MVNQRKHWYQSKSIWSVIIGFVLIFGESLFHWATNLVTAKAIEAIGLAALIYGVYCEDRLNNKIRKVLIALLFIAFVLNIYFNF